MSDIFLSYDNRDLERIKPLAAALTAQGWRVFYDRTIPPAKTWRQVIAKEIAECRCMVVAWSNHSIESDWVLEEADDGKVRKILVPFFLDNVKLPWGFREITAANLINWEGDQADPVFVALCDSIAEIISSTDAIGDPGYGEPGNQVQLEVDRKSKEKIEAESVEQKTAEDHSKDHSIKNTETIKDKETLKKPLKDLSASAAGIHREFSGQRSDQQAIKNPAARKSDWKSEKIGNSKPATKGRHEDKKLSKAENPATGKQNQNRTIPESTTYKNTPSSQKESAHNSIKDQPDPSIRRAKTFLQLLSIAVVVAVIIVIRQTATPETPLIQKFESPVAKEEYIQPSKPEPTKQAQPTPIKLPEMVTIPAGEFWMGSAEDDKTARDVEKPRHKVRVAAFAMGKYEVTKAQFVAFAESTGQNASGCWSWDGSQWIKDPKRPGFEESDKDPVACVSHEDAIAYIRWLNTQTGKHFRLPTEAEWEYAARAGSTGDYFWGNANATQYAWFFENSNHSGTVPVDDVRFKPNAFGLYHVAGNVWEWVADCWHASYEQAPINANSAWLAENAGNCSQRVQRGGSWVDRPNYLRSATRSGGLAGDRDGTIGFRLAQDLP